MIVIPEKQDLLLGKNTMFMVSNAETDRMRRLARERIEYVVKAKMSGDSDTNILLKIGLQVDKEYVDPEEKLELNRNISGLNL